jgi:hypothetical protein
MFLHSKGMEDPDSEATVIHVNDHAVLQQYMCIHSKGMEDPDHEATVKHPNDHSLLGDNM